MKKLLMILAVLAVTSPAAAQLVITGAFDGPLTGGLPKGVELYACDTIDDMSIYGIGSANNGGGTDGLEFTFPAISIPAGATIYVTMEEEGFTAFFGSVNNLIVAGSSMSINGDDAIELFLVEGEIVVDVFGDINTDGTGEPWDHVDGWAKRNVATGPDGSTFMLDSWTFSGPGAFSGFPTNSACDNPFPVGGFYCDSTVSTEDMSFDSIKSLYR